MLENGKKYKFFDGYRKPEVFIAWLKNIMLKVSGF